MHMGSKHDSEASFSFQINDAVKGNEECLLADDDFLRDVNDCTIITPALLSRRAVLEHERRELTPGQTVPRTKDHGENTSYPPKQFTPSSPVFHHNGAAVNQGLKTPKPSIKFSAKSSTSKMMSTTRSTMKWPSPSRAKALPRPEASPRISKLAGLREEITMLGESDGLYPAPVEQQQEERHSDKDTSSENSSPIDSNMPVPTILQNSTQIRAKAPMNNDHSSITLRSPTQSTPVHEPRLLGSISPNDGNKEDEPVSTIIGVERLAGPELPHRHQPNGTTAFDNSWAERTICSTQDNPLTEEREASPKDDQTDSSRAPLTLSQLSPRKIAAAVHPHGPSSNSSILPISPLRPSRKRPASPLQVEKSKKGKIATRKSRDQATIGRNSVARNPSSITRRRNAAPDDRRDRCNTTRRLISSGSGSRMRSSRKPSSGAGIVVSNVPASPHSQSQSQRVNDVAGRRNERQPRKRVFNVPKDIAVAEMKAASYDSPVTIASPFLWSIAPEHGSTSQPTQEVTHDTRIVSISLPEKLSASHDQNRNDNQTEQTSQRGITTRANTAKSVDSTSKLRRSGTQIERQHEENNNKRRYFLRSQKQPLANSNRLAASNTASMSSSNSNSRSIASMTRSQFKYSHHHPIPDYKAEHALLESSLARRKENIAPIIPLSFDLHTDARAKEREKFEAVVKEKEVEMDRQRETKRKEREEQEERELRELRRKAIPKANAVPEWYKDAPRRKRRTEQAQGSESCRTE